MSTTRNKTDLEREKLPAEKKFDKWAYGGISYVAQALAGSGLTYWVKHAGGRPLYDKMANWLGPNLIEKISKRRGAEAIKSADYWITVSTMVFVGSLFVIPVKLLEDKKEGIVEDWTKKDNEARAARGEPLTPEELAEQQDLLNQLKASPKQTWTSMAVGRAASLIPVYTALPLIGEWNKVMEKGFQDVAKAAVKGAGFKKAAESQALHNATGIAFYDGFYSIISAGGLYVFSKLTAGFSRKKEAALAKELAEGEPSWAIAQHQIDEAVAPYTETPKSRPHAQKKAESFTDLVKTNDSNLQMAL